MTGKLLRSFAVVGATGLALLGLTPAAQAHTAKIAAECVDGKAVLTVALADYDGARESTIVVTNNGARVVKAGFKSGYVLNREFTGTINHRFVVTVEAWDDPDSSRGWSFTQTATVPRCVKTTPPSSTSSTPSSTPVPTTTATTTAATTTVPVTSTKAVAAPVVDQTPPLAATGASSLWTLLVGMGLLVAGTGAMLLVRRRKA